MNKIVFLQAARSLFTEQASKCVMDTRDSDLGDDSMVSAVEWWTVVDTLRTATGFLRKTENKILRRQKYLQKQYFKWWWWGLYVTTVSKWHKRVKNFFFIKKLMSWVNLWNGIKSQSRFFHLIVSKRTSTSPGVSLWQKKTFMWCQKKTNLKNLKGHHFSFSKSLNSHVNHPWKSREVPTRQLSQHTEIQVAINPSLMFTFVIERNKKKFHKRSNKLPTCWWGFLSAIVFCWSWNRSGTRFVLDVDWVAFLIPRTINLTLYQHRVGTT